FSLSSGSNVELSAARHDAVRADADLEMTLYLYKRDGDATVGAYLGKAESAAGRLELNDHLAAGDYRVVVGAADASMRGEFDLSFSSADAGSYEPANACLVGASDHLSGSTPNLSRLHHKELAHSEAQYIPDLDKGQILAGVQAEYEHAETLQ